MDDMETSRVLILLIIIIQFLSTVWDALARRLRLSIVPKKIEEHTFHKDVIVLVIGRKNSGRQSLINAYNQAKESNRFHFPSENIHFIRLSFETVWSGKLKPDVIWFVINYQGHTSDEDFDILSKLFPQIPVVVILNKVDQLQQCPGHAFDLIATAELPDGPQISSQLDGTRKRYQALRVKRKFFLSQMMLTSMRTEEDDTFIGLLGLYQATLNCMDDKQFEWFNNAVVTDDERDFLNTVKEIKRYKKNSWRVILICGSSNNGKSTLINALLGAEMARIGQDGTPTTKALQIFPRERSKLLLVDSAGLEKHDNADKFAQLTSIRPDLIWLIVNYAGSVETTELDISTKYFPNAPLLLIVNKVDILREVTIDERELNNFDSCVPSALANHQRLMAFRSKLIVHENVRRLLLLSLKGEEEDDKPIGLKNLIHVTEQHLSSRPDQVEQPPRFNNNASITQSLNNTGLVRRNKQV